MEVAPLLVAELAAAGGIVWVVRRIRARRRRRELAFMLTVADRMARKARLRPAVDRRVQRRRYAR